jgi:hypothetical protein
VVPGRGSRGERLVARLSGAADHTHNFQPFLIAAFTFAASSGVTSLIAQAAFP